MTVKKKKKSNCRKASRERAKFMILPIDGARACQQIGLDRRQLGLVRKDGKIVDNGKI